MGLGQLSRLGVLGFGGFALDGSRHLTTLHPGLSRSCPEFTAVLQIPQGSAWFLLAPRDFGSKIRDHHTVDQDHWSVETENIVMLAGTLRLINIITLIIMVSIVTIAFFCILFLLSSVSSNVIAKLCALVVLSLVCFQQTLPPKPQAQTHKP